MSKKNEILLTALYISANFTIIGLILLQWNELKELPHVISNYSEHSDQEYFGVNKFITQNLFYLAGIGLSLFASIDFLTGRMQKRKSIVLFGIYFIVFILLELPLYDKHKGWEKLHGHSYWKNFHFH